eukprot:scaffold55719_cov20-Tisochrysis_lutea.AAC.1
MPHPISNYVSVAPRKMEMIKDTRMHFYSMASAEPACENGIALPSGHCLKQIELPGIEYVLGHIYAHLNKHRWNVWQKRTSFFKFGAGNVRSPSLGFV